MIGINTAFHFLSALTFGWLCWYIIRLSHQMKTIKKIHTRQQIYLDFNTFFKLLAKTYNIKLEEKSTIKIIHLIKPKVWLDLVSNNKIDKIIINPNKKASCQIFTFQDKIPLSEEKRLNASMQNKVEIKIHYLNS